MRMLRCGVRRCLVVLLVVAASSWAMAGTPRIMLVGDSWAWFMWLNRSFQHALERAGLGQFEEIGLYTTVPGSTSAQWTNPAWLDNIRLELERNPTVDIVHISLGGNGFLRNWKPEMPDEKRDALFQKITDEIEVVVKYCLDLKPTMRVAVCGYDYVNDKRSNGTVPDLNRAGMVLSGMKREMCKRYGRAVYIQNYGVMQHWFGVPPDIAPKSLPLPGKFPDFDPWPGGDSNYGNAPEAMLDRIHLSPQGYEHLADRCIEVAYKAWLEGRE